MSTLDDDLLGKAQEEQRRAENPAGGAVSGLESEEQYQQAYEEAAARLIKLLSSTATTKSHVHSINIHGRRHTRESFLRSVVRPAFKTRTVSTILETVQRAVADLRRFDIFDDVDLLLDAARDPIAVDGSVDVHINVKEKPRLFIKTGTEIGNGEGSMNGSINIRNVFGGAETLETNISFGTSTSSAFQFCLARPVNTSPDARIDINAFNLVRNTPYSSYEEALTGGGVRFKALSKLGYHELSYGAIWRTVDRLAETASLSIRNQAGHSLKCALTHTFTRDRRDDPLLPTQGYFVRAQQELAGVGGLGDTHHVRNDAEAQVAARLPLGFVLSATLRGGLLYTLDGVPSRIVDRFQLGGSTSVRGFRTGGIGPRDRKDALGGDAYWAGGVSLTSPLPRLSEYPVRAHLFVNAGTLVPYNHNNTPQQTLESLTRSPSVAAGLGLIYRHSIARLELNFCVPLAIAMGDQYKKGLQIGLGLSFL